MRRVPFFLLAACTALFRCALLPSPAEAKVKWKDVDRALLAETQGIVDPEAPSETVFWEIRVTDTFDGKWLRSEEQNYMRVKVFHERGRDLEAQVEIPYLRGESVDDIAGRTVRPNGTVVELKKDAVFDRTVVKVGGLRGKAKSFAMPGVEPGAVVEYQWKRVRRDIPGLVLYAQRTTPIRSMTLVITPYNTVGWPYTMRVRSFNISHDPPERSGMSLTIRLSKILGTETEPYMPPDNQVRPWFLLEYAPVREPSTDEYWTKAGTELHKHWKPYIEVSAAVRNKADSLIAGITEFDRQIQAIHDFCRTKIRNVYDDAYDFTDELRSRLLDDEKRMPDETLRRGYGTSRDINYLFAALAQAAGFQSRMAVVSDRSEHFFRRDNKLGFQLAEHLVAVQISGRWRFYDPSIRDIPAGMLPWWEESQEALVLDGEKPVFITTPLSPPGRSVARRTGVLRLGADGALQGEVREIYTGHLAAREKENLDELSPGRREEEVRRQLRERWASASVDSLALSGVDDPLQPYGIAYRITIPEYAERAGKRLLVQPEVFERGAPPVFTAGTRTHWLYFNHPWAEEDSVTLELPSGYEIEADPAPDPLNIGRTITHRMAVEVEERTVRLHRYFAFGMDGTILIDPSEYGRVKKGFVSKTGRDGYTVTLRPAEAAER